MFHTDAMVNKHAFSRFEEYPTNETLKNALINLRRQVYRLKPHTD
jgi:hypothetical protein